MGCLDHIYSNCATHITNVTTSKNKRDYSLLTKLNLQQYYNYNTEIQKAFNHSNPNTIAEIIINQVNIIINSIAPAKKIQCKKKYAKWLNINIKNQGDIKNKAHKI